jgi:hypothetical protein
LVKQPIMPTIAEPLLIIKLKGLAREIGFACQEESTLNGLIAFVISFQATSMSPRLLVWFLSSIPLTHK